MVKLAVKLVEGHIRKSFSPHSRVLTVEGSPTAVLTYRDERHTVGLNSRVFKQASRRSISTDTQWWGLFHEFAENNGYPSVPQL